MSEAVVVVRRTFRATRERIFRAWSDPRELVEWFSPQGFCNPTVDADVRPGGTFRIAMKKLPDGEPFYAAGTYKTVEPPKRLVFSWSWEDPGERVRDTVVTIDFLDRGESTEVVLTHELLPDERRETHTQGWTAILAKLDATLQTNHRGEPA